MLIHTPLLQTQKTPFRVYVKILTVSSGYFTREDPEES